MNPSLKIILKLDKQITRHQAKQNKKKQQQKNNNKKNNNKKTTTKKTTQTHKLTNSPDSVERINISHQAKLLFKLLGNVRNETFDIFLSNELEQFNNGRVDKIVFGSVLQKQFNQRNEGIVLNHETEVEFVFESNACSHETNSSCINQVISNQ
jgi:hypothetical protein